MIREAALADLADLVAMGQTFLRASPYASVLPENPTQIAALFTTLIEQDHGVMLVADHDGVLTGMIGIVVLPHHFSAEPMAMEACWWSTTPGDGVRLLKASERWARARGAVAMQMVAPTERVGALYARLGYGLIEYAYVRRLDA
jgi:Acetyltransferase (GNAT) family